MQNGVILCRLEFISSTICNRLCRYIVLIIVLCYGSYKNREDTIKNTLACIMFLKSKIYIAFFFFLLLEHRDWETTTFKWTITHKHIPVSHLSSITYLVTKVYHSNGRSNVTGLSNVYSMTWNSRSWAKYIFSSVTHPEYWRSPMYFKFPAKIFKTDWFLIWIFNNSNSL